jgi:hypothetical protein
MGAVAVQGYHAPVPIVELPTLPRREPVCPAAEKVVGVATHDGGCVCRIQTLDQEAETGIGMDPHQLQVARESTGGAFLTVKTDPSTVLRFCFGDAVPVITGEDGQACDSYTYCPVWQRRRERDIEARRRLFDPVEPDGVAMGIEEPQAVASWEVAGLDELAPS